MSDIEVSQLDMGLIRTGTEGSPQNHIVASNSNRNPGRDRDPERNPGTGGTNKPKEVGEPKVEPTVKPKVEPTVEPPSQKYQWGNEDLAGEMDPEVRNEALRGTMNSLTGVEDFVDAAETVLDANATIADKVVAVGGAIAKRTPLGKGVSKAVTKRVEPKLGSAGGPGAGKAFSQKTQDAARAEANNTCVFCGVETIRSKKPHPQRSNIDHAIPKSRNGNNTLENAQNTCQTCNLDKRAQTTREYLERLNGGG